MIWSMAFYLQHLIVFTPHHYLSVYPTYPDTFIDLLKKSYSYIIDIKMFRCDYNEMQVYYNTDVVWTALPV